MSNSAEHSCETGADRALDELTGATHHIDSLRQRAR
jgi:hypothetical protein